MKINLISGPRNISTALMYSFAQRSDTRVVDEPFYGYYLKETGTDHPGKKETLETMPLTLDEVLKKWVLPEEEKPILFLKNMAHHLIMEDLEFLKSLNNLFLIRDPEKLIRSFSKVIPNPQMSDIGLEREWNLFQWIAAETDKDPVVIDSGVVLMDPEKVLTKLCEKLGIPFDQAMLSWPAGPRPEDGVWAPYWYKNVHRSTGFQKPKETEGEFPEHCRDLLDECLPYYRKLLEHSITL